MRRGGWLALALVAGCASTPVERGRARFDDPALSDARINELACSDCHTAGPPPADFIPSGGSLAGVVGRPTFFGGQVRDLRAAVNQCLYLFMLDSRQEALGPTDPRGLELLEYLRSLGTAPVAAVPFTVVEQLDDLPAGDAARGEGLYRRACLSCHGAPRTGAGAALRELVIVPTETIMEHGDFAQSVAYAKIRHGAFFGSGGAMPPFSREALSDQDVADVLAYSGF